MKEAQKRAEDIRKQKVEQMVTKKKEPEIKEKKPVDLDQWA